LPAPAFSLALLLSVCKDQRVSGSLSALIELLQGPLISQLLPLRLSFTNPLSFFSLWIFAFVQLEGCQHALETLVLASVEGQKV